MWTQLTQVGGLKRAEYCTLEGIFGVVEVEVQNAAVIKGKWSLERKGLPWERKTEKEVRGDHSQYIESAIIKSAAFCLEIG